MNNTIKHTIHARLREKLQGGDKRSVGAAGKVMEQIEKTPTLFNEIYRLIYDIDPVVALRAVDIVEKLSRKYPSLIIPYKRHILEHLPEFKTKEHRWHIAQLLVYFKFSAKELKKVYHRLLSWANDETSGAIARANCVEAIQKLSFRYPELRPAATELASAFENTGSPAVKARIRKIRKEPAQ